MDLVCWKCGASLKEILQPFSRDAQCLACDSDLHVCLMCRFYDKSRYNQCREPVAEQVRDKDRSNFCDYFKPREGAHDEALSGNAMTAKNNLEDLFGGLTSEKEGSKESIDDLFK